MKKLLLKLYSYRILSEFMLLYSLYTVMFVERGGLSVLQVSIMLGLWSAVILILEIPSGALADKYSRRKLLGWAQLVRAVGYSIWVFWPTFEGFLLGLMLWGIARSVTSGTYEALVFDELNASGQAAKYAKVMGRTESMALFVGLGSTLLAVPAYALFGYQGVLWFSVAATVLSAIIAFTLPDKKKQKSVEAPAYMAILRQAAQEVKNNPNLIKLFAFGIFVGMLFRVFDEFASLIIKASDVPTVYVPLVSTLIFLPVILAGFVAYRIEHLKQITFMVFLVVAGLALMAAGLLSPIGLLSFAAFLLLIKLAMTVFGAKVQHAIAGETRATITSINSFGIEVSAVVAFFFYGLLSQLGTGYALMIFGAMACAVGLTYLIITRGRLLSARLTNR